MLVFFAGCDRPVPDSRLSPEKEPGSDKLLVVDGEAKAVIVVGAQAGGMEREAAELLQRYIERSTGAKLAIVTEGSEAEVASPLEKVYVGATAALAREGVDVTRLEEEAYGIKTTLGGLFLFGRDEGLGHNVNLNARRSTTPRGAHWSAYRTPATKWAVNDLAQEIIGVRWLWPGPLGTFVPKKPTLRVASRNEIRQPLLLRRTYMAKQRLVAHGSDAPTYLVDLKLQERLQKEARDWMEDHQAGNRTEIFYGHAFSDWWEKYGALDPTLFAVPPSDRFRQPFPNANRVKLRLSNPSVLDRIEQEYLAAGKPATWAISPNDGSGFDTSDATAAWDLPQGQDKLTIWQAKGQLTARYVHFWNLVHERLRRHNPGVKLTVLAYGCYRQPPPQEVDLSAKLIMGIVNGYKGEEPYAAWKGWAARGAELLLRPNWWHVGVHVPYLEPRAQGDYVRFAAEHGMIGFSADSLMGYWATQGLNYYVVARLVADPKVTPDEAIAEYTAAFGAAEPKIREYFDYWMELSRKVNYAGAMSQHTGDHAQSSLYQEMAVRHGFTRSVLTGSFRAIPYLYDAATFTVPERLLAEARRLAEADTGNREALERVRFLEDGLAEFRLTRDLLEIGYQIKEKKRAELLPEFQRKGEQLRKLRAELTPRHVIWGEALYENEIRRGVPTTKWALPRLKENLDGL
ncbi:MAG TPA: DUF4838 domain-containing protein [Chthoniobacteraceae bacterium]|nr:DUF4838 domain-containing protein [Chthoniobacteraceae bacterium]